jgi:hypothetical protein
MSTEASTDKRYDVTSVNNLLEDWQIDRLRGLYRVRSEGILRSLVRVYGQFAEYCPDELAQELRNRRDAPARDVADLVLIEALHPLNYVLGAAPLQFDWKGIAHTIESLDAVRRGICKDLARQPRAVRQLSEAGAFSA